MLDHGALIVDLTALGAGVLSDVEAHTGDLLRLDVVLPTPSGVTSARIPATVRNIRLDFSGGHRLGVQFGEVDAYVADTLAEYCIVQPGLEVLGTAPPIDRSDVRPVIVVDAEPGGPRRLGLRAAALIAVAGALASAAPRSAEASISEETVRGSVVVRSGDGAPSAAVAGAVALAVCAADPGADATFGTTDDDYLSPRTAVSGADGAYDVVAAGAACWVSVALPSGRLVQRAAGELSSRSDIEVVDMTTGDAPAVETTRAAGVNAGEAQPANIVVTDRVYADLDGNGLDAGADVGLGGVTVTLYSSTGAVVGRTTTADDGTYRAELPADITYRVGLSELPEGWRTEQPDGLSSIRRADASDAPGVGIGLEAAPSVSSLAALAAPLPVGTRLFPAPDAADLAESSSTGIPNGVAALIVAVAALLAVSVLVGSLVPFRRREPGLGAEWGDGWSDGGPWSGGDWSGGGVGAGDQSSADLAIR